MLIRKQAPLFIDRMTTAGYLWPGTPPQPTSFSGWRTHPTKASCAAVRCDVVVDPVDDKADPLFIVEVSVKVSRLCCYRETHGRDVRYQLFLRGTFARYVALSLEMTSRALKPPQPDGPERQQNGPQHLRLIFNSKNVYSMLKPSISKANVTVVLDSRVDI